MKHEVELSAEERVQAWLDLCEFNLRLMESALDRPRLEERFSRMREDDLRGHREFLRRLGELGL